jgi:predicted RNA methylase
MSSKFSKPQIKSLLQSLEDQDYNQFIEVTQAVIGYSVNELFVFNFPQKLISKFHQSQLYSILVSNQQYYVPQSL